MSLNTILFFVIALLCLGMILILSTMRIKSGGSRTVMFFTIDTDTSQKNKIFVAYIIIDIAIIIFLGIAFYITLFLMPFNWLYVSIALLGTFMMARNVYRSQRDVFADYFKKIP
jgi:hypothetical protein